MASNTEKNLYDSYTGESKAVTRLRAYARKADKEDYPEIARLFRAIAESENIHAYNSIKFLDVIKDTEANLEESLAREEKIAQIAYDGFIQQALDDDKPAIATTFTYSRDVEARHEKLYEQALQHLVAEDSPAYFVCEVCGYVADTIVPEKCPVCAAPPEKFFEVT